MKKWLLIIIIIFLIIIITTFLWLGICALLLRKEHITEVSTFGDTNTKGEIFVAYRPGLTNYQKETNDLIVEELVNKNWTVKTTTISSGTPINLTEFEYIIIIAPIYAGKVHPNVKTYLNSLDLKQTQVLGIAISGGKDPKSMQNLRGHIQTANGKLIGELHLGFTGKPEIGAEEHMIDFIKEYIN